jgi:hypothetical protein
MGKASADMQGNAWPPEETRLAANPGKAIVIELGIAITLGSGRNL